MTDTRDSHSKTLWAKTAVASLEVDPQCSFSPLCPKELPVPQGDEIVDALNAQATYAHYRLASKDAHPINPHWLANAEHPALSPIQSPHMDCYWPAHAIPGTRGFELLPGLPHPSAYDYLAFKGVEPDMHPYGACYHDLAERRSTGLIEFLQVNAVSLVIVGGLATDYCVKTTVLQLRRAQFSVIVNQSACRALTPEGGAAALKTMENHGALLIDKTEALDAWVSKAS